MGHTNVRPILSTAFPMVSAKIILQADSEFHSFRPPTAVISQPNSDSQPISHLFFHQTSLSGGQYQTHLLFIFLQKGRLKIRNNSNLSTNIPIDEEILVTFYQWYQIKTTFATTTAHLIPN